MNNRILVFACGRNCENFIVDHLFSIFIQTYKNYRYILVDDASNDNTPSLIRLHISKFEDAYFIFNYKRHRSAKNIYEYLKPDDDDIIVIVDADDRLISAYVLDYINRIYNYYDCWLTYGSMIWQSTMSLEGKEYTLDIKQKKSYREYEWLAVHLLTFKGFLFRNIKRESFLDSNGSFLTSVTDQALAFPMLEMCPADKIRFVREPLYIYNDKNPQSVMYTEKEQQKLNEVYIRNLPRYKELIR